MMIGGIAQQRLRAVQLFQKNDTRQLVGQSLRAERYQMPGSGAHGFRQAERSPENKAGATISRPERTSRMRFPSSSFLRSAGSAASASLMTFSVTVRQRPIRSI